jgi:hypothetical protein
MALLTELLDFIVLIKELFQAYQKVKAEAWFQDLLKVKDQVLKARTSEEKKDAARELSRLLSNL